MQLLIFAMSIFVFERNARPALEFAGYFRTASKTVEDAVNARKPIPQIAQLWTTWFSPVDPSHLDNFIAERFRMLRSASIGPYRFAADPLKTEVVEIPIDIGAAATNNAIWKCGSLQVLGDESWAVLRLPEPRFVYAIRFTYRYEALEERANFKLNWRLKTAGQDFDMSRWAVFALPAPPAEQAFTVIVNESIDSMQLHPGVSAFGKIEISRIELLVPEPAAGSAAGD
jgi:hypothetical protein